jgi:hypothetical protein
MKHHVDLRLCKLIGETFVKRKLEIEVYLQVRYTDKEKNEYSTKRIASATEICLYHFLFSIQVGYFVALGFTLTIC